MYWRSDGKIKIFISMIHWMWAWCLGSKTAWLALDMGKLASLTADRGTAVRSVGLKRKRLLCLRWHSQFSTRDIPEYYFFQISYVFWIPMVAVDIVPMPLLACQY